MLCHSPSSRQRPQRITMRTEYVFQPWDIRAFEIIHWCNAVQDHVDPLNLLGALQSIRTSQWIFVRQICSMTSTSIYVFFIIIITTATATILLHKYLGCKQ